MLRPRLPGDVRSPAANGISDRERRIDTGNVSDLGEQAGELMALGAHDAPMARRNRARVFEPAMLRAFCEGVAQRRLNRRQSRVRPFL